MGRKYGTRRPSPDGPGKGSRSPSFRNPPRSCRRPGIPSRRFGDERHPVSDAGREQARTGRPEAREQKYVHRAPPREGMPGAPRSPRRTSVRWRWSRLLAARKTSPLLNSPQPFHQGAPRKPTGRVPSPADRPKPVHQGDRRLPPIPARGNPAPVHPLVDTVPPHPGPKSTRPLAPPSRSPVRNRLPPEETLPVNNPAKSQPHPTHPPPTSPKSPSPNTPPQQPTTPHTPPSITLPPYPAKTPTPPP